MTHRQQRLIVLSVAIVAAIWALAWAGYAIARNAKVTPQKVRAYMNASDLGHLAPAARAKAIKKLANLLNALSLEERRRLRLGRAGGQWFEQMTDEEKSEFINATLPTGFKQMLAAFEAMPPERRKRMVDQAVKQMQTMEARRAADEQSTAGTNRALLSEELQQKITTIGLQSVYRDGSAQTKEELAPLLAEIQRMMRGGRMGGGGGPQ